MVLLRKLYETAVSKVEIFSWVSEEISSRAWSSEPPVVEMVRTHLWCRAMWSVVYEWKDLETAGRDSVHM